MGEIEYDAFRYSYTVIVVFGILGNSLVILSILRQKKSVLKNNYYFLVLHLAICDLAVLIFYFFYAVGDFWLEEPLTVASPIFCHLYIIADAFQLAGVGMMLIISLLRYRATVHSLKPAISRRKLKVLCGLVYLAGLIAACGINFPLCFIKSTVLFDAFLKFYFAFWVVFAFLGPTIFMAVVYFKISRSLMKQNKHMKRVCPNAMRQREPDSSFNILKYTRNRRTFLVCLGTVLSYVIGSIPWSVWIIHLIVGAHHLRFLWVRYFARILRFAGSHSANPFIYGILDKKLLTFWKGSCKKKRKAQEGEQIAVVV